MTYKRIFNKSASSEAETAFKCGIKKDDQMIDY